MKYLKYLKMITKALCLFQVAFYSFLLGVLMMSAGGDWIDKLWGISLIAGAVLVSKVVIKNIDNWIRD